ncbi:hypothetical protein [Bartonella sp. AU18XJBT]|uniref:hypothetical protein n=1 Tax=Bartonella sp. AU18XJBT TaxID=3019089 RepID=UPI002362B7EA|nr:hypothetical protein [Bartonella sp. AU18XJBT]
MSKNRLLCILMTIIVCFSQIVEAYANFWRGSFSEDVFIMIVDQEKKPFISAKNKDFIAISGKTPRDKENAIIGPTVKDAIFTVYFFSLESLSLSQLESLKDGF